MCFVVSLSHYMQMLYVSCIVLIFQKSTVSGETRFIVLLKNLSDNAKSRRKNEPSEKPIIQTTNWIQSLLYAPLRFGSNYCVCIFNLRLLDRPEIQHLFAFKFSHKALKPRSLKCVCRLPPVKLTSKSYSPSDSTFSDPTLKTSLVSVYRATTAQCYSTDKRRERLWLLFFICFSTMYKWCWHTHFPKVGIYANQVRENVKIC